MYAKSTCVFLCFAAPCFFSDSYFQTQLYLLYRESEVHNLSIKQILYKHKAWGVDGWCCEWGSFPSLYSHQTMLDIPLQHVLPVLTGLLWLFWTVYHYRLSKNTKSSTDNDFYPTSDILCHSSSRTNNLNWNTH